MNPIVLSPELLAHLQTLQTDVQQWLTNFQQFRNQSVSWNRLSDDQQQEWLQRQTQLQALASALTQTLTSATSGTLPPSTGLSALYDRVVELGINMNTQGSRTLAQAYQTAINNFLTAYNGADANTQTEWQTAKNEVDESNATLQAKLARAQQVLANRQNNGPIGGYFRYIEGTVQGQRYRRLDWLSDMVNFRGETYHVGNNTSNDQYSAGTNRFIIELYTPQSNDKGGLDFVRNGTAYSLSSSALELFGQLTGPYKRAQDSVEGKFPALEYNNTPNNRNPRWSMVFKGTTQGTQLDIDLPTWDDYGATRLVAQYRIDCANFRLTQASSDAAIQAINNAIAQQQTLYRALDVIRQELAARTNNKLDQQEDEIVALLAIWRDRITGFQRDVDGLDFRNCIQPPVAINVAINYWTGDLTNPTQALANLNAAGVLTRLQTFPNAQIQITATFDFGNNADYLADPSSYMGSGYSDAWRAKQRIPSSIQTRRDYLTVKANNLRNLIIAQPGINASQVVANTTPGDTGPHMGSGAPFGNRMNIVWLRNQ